ncbi:uncharacterized protein CMU_029100 [Cryptosporidium muris RN66]|uniref:Uncharacterized protein n=1 Tax=Cryptosporidium muris (strain RN66) TaxID=441375 RepID=B6AHZ5_CRYMR|nr:uncharacterized protein CMU_029100 [Cryptosporidium muris RN66]EEA07836.1 hypothetical protein CMU_029100 [Cryptosporidium muris RN66]|eukprot:XP_002142185.1 hypothetical protein [Cryptosporidium muris RN66]
MEAYLADVPTFIKAIQSLQLSRAIRKDGDGQFLTCSISTSGIKLSNHTTGKDVFCCCWLKKEIFKKFECLNELENSHFDICLNTLINCIQVFGLDAKMAILRYDNANLHLSITEDEGAMTDCVLCTYHTSEDICEIQRFMNTNDGYRSNGSSTNTDYIMIFPHVLRDLLKDLCDIAKNDSKVSCEYMQKNVYQVFYINMIYNQMTLELFPLNINTSPKHCVMSFSCKLDGEECCWELFDNHNVFPGYRIDQYHNHTYMIKSLFQIERALAVCSTLRIKINKEGLLAIQMIIKQDIHPTKEVQSVNADASLKYINYYNTEVLILPVNKINGSASFT